MIKIIAKTTVSEENLAGFLEAVKPLAEASRAKEGNLAYNICKSQANADEIIFVEEWKNQMAIDIHNSSAYFVEIVPTLGAFCSSEIIVEKYDVLV